MSESGIVWNPSTDAAIGTDPLIADPEVPPWGTVAVIDADGERWTVRGRWLPGTPGSSLMLLPETRMTGSQRRSRVESLSDELPFLELLLLVVPAALVAIEVVLLGVAAPAAWVWRRSTGRPAPLVVRRPSGQSVPAPPEATGGTVRERRAQVVALIRSGQLTPPELAVEPAEDDVAERVMIDDPTVSCAGPGQPLIRRRRPIVP